MSNRGAKAGRRLRAEAARSVAEIVSGRASLSAYYGRWAAREGESPPLLRALVTDCLRWHHRLQWQLEQLLDRPLPAKEAQLAALLRLGLLQLQFMRIPAHAAVDETVAAAAHLGRAHARGLVNAVLRRFGRESAQLAGAMAEHDEARLSHPRWLIDALRRDRPEIADAVLNANNAQPPLWLRVNRLRRSRDAYANELTQAGIEFFVDERLPDALRLAAALPSARLPGFADGVVSVQDRAAQLAADYLDPAPGQRVLDACAAPGGKTAAILERCDALRELVALDSSERRLQTLRDNLARLGLAANVVCADATEASSWWDGQPFDRVLLDAPCSATGVIRRHPDIKLRRTPDDVARVTQTQQALLESLWPVLAKDGRLVYVTCSVLRCENERQIERFVNAHADAVLVEQRQYFPGEADGDGFYYACVKKRE